MTCCHGVTGAGRTMLYPLSICVTPTHQRSRSYYDPHGMPAGHKRLISTVAASTPNDRRVIPDLTPSGASVLVVSFLHGIFHTVQAMDGGVHCPGQRSPLGRFASAES